MSVDRSLVVKRQGALQIAGIEVPVVMDDAGQGFVVIRRVVEAMGMSWSRQAEAIQERFPSCAHMRTTGSDGKNYRMKALSVSDFLLCLVAINVSKVGEDVRPILKDFQDNAAAMLFRWLHEAQAQGVDATSPEAAGIELPSAEKQLRQIAEKKSFKYDPLPVRGADRYVTPEFELRIEVVDRFFITAYLVGGRPYFWPGDFSEALNMTAGAAGDYAERDPALHEHHLRVRRGSGHWQIYPARLAAAYLGKMVLGGAERQRRAELLSAAVPTVLENWAVEMNRARWTVEAKQAPQSPGPLAVNREVIANGDRMLLELVPGKDGMTVNCLRKRLNLPQSEIMASIRFLMTCGLLAMPEQPKVKAEMRRVFLADGARATLQPTTVFRVSCGQVPHALHQLPHTTPKALH